MIICPKCRELKNIDEISTNKRNRGHNDWCKKCVSKANGAQKMRREVVKPPKEVLVQMYINEKMTPTKIAEKLEVSTTPVGNWLREYEIPVRNHSEAQLIKILKIPKEELKYLYLIKLMTPTEIAKKLEVSDYAIRNWLMTYGIPMRTISEAKLLADNGGENCSFYIDGREKENSPYCDLWTPELRERCRDFFYRTCQNCGKTEAEQMEDQKSRNVTQKILDVHHVFYNKDTCCDNSERFILPLCSSCHSSINNSDPQYEYVFAREIRKKYGGICFFPKYMTDTEERKAYRQAAMNNKW